MPPNELLVITSEPTRLLLHGVVAQRVPSRGRIDLIGMPSAKTRKQTR